MKDRIGIECVIGWCVLQPDLVEVHLQLLGDQHGQRRVHALAHLHHWHHQRHCARAVYANESVRSKVRRPYCPRRLQHQRQCQVENQAASDGGSDFQKTAPIEG